MLEIMSHPAMITLLVIVLVLSLANILRALSNYYSDNKVSIVMLAVEKRLSTWAVEQAANAGEKKAKASELLAEYVYPLLPMYVKIFVTKEKLQEKIEYLYTEMLDLLDDWELNDSIQWELDDSIQ